jgi:hypothetical protein
MILMFCVKESLEISTLFKYIGNELLEQRISIIFLVKLEKNASNTHKMER